MIDRAFLCGLGLDPGQIRKILEAHKAEARLRAACVAVGIALPISEKIVAAIHVDEIPTEDPELLRILVNEEWGGLAREKGSTFL